MSEELEPRELGLKLESKLPVSRIFFSPALSLSPSLSLFSFSFLFPFSVRLFSFLNSLLRFLLGRLLHETSAICSPPPPYFTTCLLRLFHGTRTPAWKYLMSASLRVGRFLTGARACIIYLFIFPRCNIHEGQLTRMFKKILHSDHIEQTSDNKLTRLRSSCAGSMVHSTAHSFLVFQDDRGVQP